MMSIQAPATQPQHHYSNHHNKNESSKLPSSANQVRSNPDTAFSCTANGVTSTRIPIQQAQKPPQRNRSKIALHDIETEINYLCLRGRLKEALDLFNAVRAMGVLVESNIYAHLLRACAHIKVLAEGKQIHALMIVSGIQLSAFLGTSLVNMYAKCGSLGDAKLCFDSMPEGNVFSWNTMIGVCARQGYYEEALGLYYQMEDLGIVPDKFTFPSVLKACAGMRDVQQGREIHCHIKRFGFESDVFVGNALVDMYAKCGQIEDARQVFDKMPRRDSVSWNAMIAGYAQSGEHGGKALGVLRDMVSAGVKVNKVTVLSVLSACSELATLKQGKEIHCYVIRMGFELNVAVRNSIVGMYVRCGSIESAHRVFDKMPWADAVSWTALIAGYVEDGQGIMALQLFRHMQVVGMAADSVTISSILPACARLGTLKQGKEIHGYGIRHGLQANAFVESALIDMYANCGSIENARLVFDKTSQGDVAIWNVMIAGYGMHGYGNDAITLFGQMQVAGMKPNNITFTALLSACSYAGLADEAWHYFNCMVREYNIKPSPEHYAYMVDLLGRAGYLVEAHELIKKMPFEPNANVWGALLAACRVHCKGNPEVGVAECLVELNPGNAGNYVLLSNIYAAAGRWDDVAKARARLTARL